MRHKKTRSVLNIHGKVGLNDVARLDRGSSISIGPESGLKFGENFTISIKSTIIASGNRNIIIDDCLLSWDLLVMNNDFHKIYLLGKLNQIHKINE